jgi:hypothetical protein
MLPLLVLEKAQKELVNHVDSGICSEVKSLFGMICRDDHRS